MQGKDVPYIDFDAVVGRNSAFINLMEEQLEVLGGAKYIALKFLLKVLAGVSISLWNFLLKNDHLPFSSITLVLTWSAGHSWCRILWCLNEPHSSTHSHSQCHQSGAYLFHYSIHPYWLLDRASVFLVTTAIMNLGISLVDMSMVPFQQEHVVMIVTAFLILAGDTGFVSGCFMFQNNPS